MKYERPAVVRRSSATDVIRSSQKIDTTNPDGGGVYRTNSAYEADE